MPYRFETSPDNIFFRCVEDSSEAIMISDDKGKLVYVNPAWCRIYGYEKDEAAGQTPRLLHSGMQSDEFYRDMWSRISDPRNGHWKGELVNKAKDGTLVPVMLTITPFKLEGAIRGYMGIAVDISQKKELESKVAHQDRLASIGMLASGLAHEVGTPLGVIRGRAEFLMMTVDEASKKNLDVIVTQIDRISKLIRSLLRVSRSFSDIMIENVSLESAVSEIITLLGPNLREDTVEVRTEIPPGMTVKADFNRLEQILMNLIMNAIHAIQKAIQGGRRSPHLLLVKAVDREQSIELIIQDSGCGIPAANMKRLFKPFFTTKDVGEGTGLGLAIVAQLINEIGATIRVESVVNQGTSFIIAFKKS